MADFDLGTTDLPTGLSVIEASAGTGKTWTISHLVPRLLVDGVVGGIGEVLLVTFTEDAARELGERVRRQLAALVGHANAGTRPEGSEPGIRLLLDRLHALPSPERSASARRLRLALDECDQLSVSTIHSFCMQVLGSEGFLCGMPARFDVLPDPVELRTDAVEDTWRADLDGDPVLAPAAAHGKWSVEKDLEAWELLTRRPSTRMAPEPLSLRDARGRLARALQAVRRGRSDLRRLQEIARRDGVSLNDSVKNPGVASVASLDAWHTELETLDPQEPPATIFFLVGSLADAGSWFRRRGTAGIAASDAAGALPIVGACTAVEESVRAAGWTWLGHLRRAAGGRYERSLRNDNAVTYDGLIQHLHRALRAGPNRLALAERLSERWKVGLIDESQDTDRQQLEIFRAIFDRRTAPGRLILVGDPKQAIYSFRGGDLDAYLSTRPADGARISSLATTYRSAPGLVRALNTLFGRRRAFGTPELLYTSARSALRDEDLPIPDDGNGRLVAWVVPDWDADTGNWTLTEPRRERAAASVATAIVDLLDRPLGADAGRVAPSEVAVLTRTNDEARTVHRALRARRVPAVLRDDDDVMQSTMASDLAFILKAVLSPTHPGWRRAAMATRLFGYDSAMLVELTDREAEEWLASFSEWNDIWHRRGIAALMTKLEARSGATLRLARTRSGERHLTDLRHLVELLQAREAEGLRSPDKLLQWFEGERASEGISADERLLRLDADGDAVQVVTIHRAKGLEFDFVFCPYLWSVRQDVRVDSRLLARRDDGWVLADGAQRDSRVEHRACTAERLMEDVRLAYVALTRARRRATFLAGPLGYTRRHALPPTSLDWLLRADEGVDGLEHWYGATARQKKDAGTCEHGETLRRLEAMCPEVMTVSAPPAPTMAAWSGGEDPDVAMHARPAPALALDPWRVTSFSQLAHGHPWERERRDIAVEPGEPGDAGPDTLPVDADVPLAAFARGTQAGNCLHELLERWDFREDTAALVDRGLERHGLHTAEDADAVRGTLEALKTTRLPSLRADLAAAASDSELSEWEFLLPLGRDGITGRALSEIFARHAGTGQQRRYARDLAGLPRRAVSGMLTGYIDRLVRADSRWGVVDWKSNYLGPRYADYSRQAMWRCAAGQHYVLQIHLYLVALRRYLKLHDAGRAAAVSGSLLFLRGVLPGTSRGVLEITPPEPLMDELDGLFSAPGGGAPN
ncbi:MAG: UvrD-helicase domain-containing protein [Gemmatimonadota bacterium]|nr:UvrD-helicase domain-containing protein [Gammaproteobacteria bacterium]MDE2983064.1 UvrD-helicase domain-containing protein [Gemmatimonadota bacterium]